MGEKKNTRRLEEKISLRKHFRFLSRIMDYSRGLIVLLLMWVKNGFAQNTAVVVRTRGVSLIVVASAATASVSTPIIIILLYTYYIIIYYIVVQSLSGNENRRIEHCNIVVYSK